MKQTPPPGEYVIDTKKSRATGTYVSVVNMTHPASEWQPVDEAPEHQYAAVCLDHDHAETTATRREAHRIASSPQSWCPGCTTGT